MFLKVKGKSQKLKDTRDYSFLLSDDAELPAPSKAPPPRDMPIQNSGMLLLAMCLYGVQSGDTTYYCN